MKKGLLSSFGLLTASIFFFLSPINSHASEKDDQELKSLTEEKGEIVYQDDEITVRTFGNDEEISEAILNHPDSSTVSTINSDSPGIQPFASVGFGNGGRASIIVLNSREVEWTVRPATAWPYNFSGFVKLRYFSGFKRDVAIGGMSGLGLSVSGSVSMKKNNGGTAYLSGRATAISGDRYTVIPGINQSFPGY